MKYDEWGRKESLVGEEKERGGCSKGGSNIFIPRSYLASRPQIFNTLISYKVKTKAYMLPHLLNADRNW